MKPAILLVTFAAINKQAQQAFDDIGKMAEQRFPEADIFWAFTSPASRLESPQQALTKLLDQGYTNVAVQPLHLIPGIEYERVYATIEQFKNSFATITIGNPLLTKPQNLLRTAEILLKTIPPEREPDDAVIFMGHGNKNHPADQLYSDFQAVLSSTYANAFIGTIKGHPTLNDLLAECRKHRIKKAWLIPLLTFAGNHAQKDMAGDHPTSWKSVLTRHHIQCMPILKGLAERADIAEIWLANLDLAYKAATKK